MILPLQFDEWDAQIKFLKASKVKELKPDCSRIVLNMCDHTVAVSDQKKDGEHLTMLQSPMRTDYNATHVLIRKASGSIIKVMPIRT